MMVRVWDPRELPRRASLFLVVACAAGLLLALYPWRSDVPRAAALLTVAGCAFVGAIRGPQVTGVGLVLILFTSLSDLVGAPDGGLSLNLVALGATLVAIAIARRRRMVGDRVVVLMLVYAAVMLLSSVGATDSLRAERAAFAFLREVAIALVLLNLLNSLSGLRVAAWAIAGAGAVLAAASVVGLATGRDLGGLARLYYGTIAGDDIGARVGSIVGDPNVFGQILVLAVPFALCAAWNEERLIRRIALLACFGLLVLTIVLTFSRGAVLGLAVVLIGCAVRQPTRKRVALAQMVAVLVVIGVLVPRPYWERLGETAKFIAGGWNLPTADASLSERSRLWRVGALMFLDHPLVGVGMDNYGLRYQDYYAQVDPNLPCCPMGAHALPIRILAETGLLGLAVFTSIVATALRGLKLGARSIRATDRESLWVFNAIEVGLIGFLASALFLDGQYMRTFWVVVALAVVARRIGETRARHWLVARPPLREPSFTQP